MCWSKCICRVKSRLRNTFTTLDLASTRKTHSMCFLAPLTQQTYVPAYRATLASCVLSERKRNKKSLFHVLMCGSWLIRISRALRCIYEDSMTCSRIEPFHSSKWLVSLDVFGVVARFTTGMLSHTGQTRRGKDWFLLIKKVVERMFSLFSLQKHNKHTFSPNCDRVTQNDRILVYVVELDSEQVYTMRNHRTNCADSTTICNKR